MQDALEKVNKISQWGKELILMHENFHELLMQVEVDNERIGYIRGGAMQVEVDMKE